MFFINSKTKRIYEIIALFTQLCEVWNKWVFIATNRFCLIRLIYTHTRHLWEQYDIYTDAWKQKTFVSRTIQYLHRCLKTKDHLCHLGNKWRHTFDTFHWVSKLRSYRWFSTTYHTTPYEHCNYTKDNSEYCSSIKNGCLLLKRVL